MPVTEHDLRDLLRERSASVPATPGLADRVQQRVRRRRRLEAGGVVGVLVLVLVASGLVVLPKREAVPGPATTPAPTHRSTQVMGTLVVTTEGPTRIDGETPFDVTVDVTNTGTKAWNGNMTVGLVYPGEVAGWLGTDDLVTSADGGHSDMGTQGPAALADTSNPQELAGVSTGTVRLAPGEHRAWTLRMNRVVGSSVLGPVYGWVPFVDESNVTDEAPLGSLDQAALVTVTPEASNRSCDTVTITSAALGDPTGWQLTDAQTTVVGADRATLWTPQQVDTGPLGIDVTTNVNRDDVRDSTVVAAVAAYLQAAADNLGATAIRATGYSPSVTSKPTTLDPGRYVAYAGARMVPVTFAGTCGPSGQPISGTWTAYYRTTEGLLDCQVTPAADLAGAQARRYCPKP